MGRRLHINGIHKNYRKYLLSMEVYCRALLQLKPLRNIFDTRHKKFIANNIKRRRQSHQGFCKPSCIFFAEYLKTSKIIDNPLQFSFSCPRFNRGYNFRKERTAIRACHELLQFRFVKIQRLATFFANHTLNVIIFQTSNRYRPWSKVFFTNRDNVSSKQKNPQRSATDS